MTSNVKPTVQFYTMLQNVSFVDNTSSCMQANFL